MSSHDNSTCHSVQRRLTTAPFAESDLHCEGGSRTWSKNEWEHGNSGSDSRSLLNKHNREYKYCSTRYGRATLCEVLLPHWGSVRRALPQQNLACFVCICTNIQTYKHTNIQTNKQTDKQTNIHTYIHAYIQTNIHTYIHTCIHTYIHTYTQMYLHTDVLTHITLHYITLHCITLHYITYIHTPNK